MKPAVRREQMLQLLKHSREPLTGNFLAKKFGISRQVIVGDISALRSQGESVIATRKATSMSRFRRQARYTRYFIPTNRQKKSFA